MLLFIARQALSLAVYFYACDSSSEQSLSFRFFRKNLSLSLAPPLSPKQISASLPRFVCFILTKKNSRHNWGNFYRFCGFLIRFFNSSFFKGTRSCSATQNALHFVLILSAWKIRRNLFRRKRKNKPLKLKLHRSFAKRFSFFAGLHARTSSRC